jgi:hypothetical protein
MRKLLLLSFFVGCAHTPKSSEFCARKDPDEKVWVCYELDGVSHHADFGETFTKVLQRMPQEKVDEIRLQGDDNR